MLLSVASLCRMVFTDALCVVSKTDPMDLRVTEIMQMYGKGKVDGDVQKNEKMKTMGEWQKRLVAKGRRTGC